MRSKRPGRSRAGSRLSGRLVAAMTHHAGGRVEAVHLGQQLVEGLLAFVVAAEVRRAAAAADGVDLVDEDDGRGLLAGVGEQVAHPGRAHADEHLHETRPGQGQERHPGLAGHGPGHQRLAGAGRADHEHAAGSDRAGVAVLVGVLEEVDHLGHFLFGPCVAGHVAEAGGGPVVEVVDAGLGAADAGDATGQGPAPPADPHEERRRSSSSGSRLTTTPRAETPPPVVPVTCTLWSWSWPASWVSGMAVGHLGGVAVAVGELAADVTVGVDGGRLDLVGVDLGDEVGEAEVRGRGPWVMAGSGEQRERHQHTRRPPARRAMAAGGAGAGRTGSRRRPGLAGLERCWYQFVMSACPSVRWPDSRRWALCC